MDEKLAAKLGLLGVRLAKKFDKIQHRLEVIKITPRMGGQCGGGVGSVSIKIVLSEFHFSSKIECYTDVDLEKIDQESWIEQTAERVRKSAIEKAWELSEKYSCAQKDVTHVASVLTSAP